MSGSRAFSSCVWAGILFCVAGMPSRSIAQTTRDRMAAFDKTLATAERHLRDGTLEAAESSYRTALLQGWILIGELRAASGRPVEARDAFQTASTSAEDNRDALQFLAMIHLQMQDAPEATRILSALAVKYPADRPIRQLLTQALVAGGQPGRAVEELERAHRESPDDPELSFLLASGYLRLDRLDEADRLFAAVVAVRPLPETWVLLGRTYRDAGQYDRARTALRKALQIDPRARRAHYYLGTVAVMAEGMVRLDEAIDEFQRELSMTPADPVVSLRLGMALVEAQRANAALPALVVAVTSPSAPPTAWLYLGRCQLALDRPAEAVASLERALNLSRDLPADAARTGNIHYLLGRALRAAGRDQEAALHFAEAEQSAAERADTSRTRLARYLTDTPDPATSTTWLPDTPFDDSLPPAERSDAERRVTGSLARVYLNLGVMRAQQDRSADAVIYLQQGARLDPSLPRVQYSLGVAHFNAQQYRQAVEPLTRALEATSADAALRRMLAMALYHAEDFARAADLLQADPGREQDAALQYVYGVALVRSERAAEAQSIFEQLLRQHGDSADLSVVLGQALAQQGDYDGAIDALRRAVRLKPDVAEANATLGVIYLKQGQLTQADEALRAQLKAHPNDFKARLHLATVLDLEGKTDEAEALIRSVVQQQPDFADARYLFGKILLARGAPQEAVEQLEAAARLAPDEPNVHYQLAQAYQKLGRAELAEQHFEAFRQLKDKRRGSRP